MLMKSYWVLGYNNMKVRFTIALVFLRTAKVFCEVSFVLENYEGNLK